MRIWRGSLPWSKAACHGDDRHGGYAPQMKDRKLQTHLDFDLLRI